MKRKPKLKKRGLGGLVRQRIQVIYPGAYDVVIERKTGLIRSLWRIRW